MPNEKDTLASDRIGLTIQWSIPDELSTCYATNLVVQHTEHEFFITFFELVPPITLSKTSEEIKQMESVQAHALTRIVVTPERLESFIQAMQENLDRYRASVNISDNTDITERKNESSDHD